MWNNPHLLIMDEPSNFLDRDALGGLATAIRDFRGGVVMISHNEELVGALCPEQWHIEADASRTRATSPSRSTASRTAPALSLRQPPAAPWATTSAATWAAAGRRAAAT